MKTLHLFAGAGGGLLADLILGHEPIAAVEWDPYCCAVLRERAEDGWFPGLRVHEGDIREFDASEYAGRVDCVHAGFPCQPFSVAGKQLGADDPRDMWPATLSVIRVVRPQWIMLENVPGLVAWNDGERVADIIGSLAGLGYVGSHGVLGADDVGAAHIRKRWWCVAHADMQRTTESRHRKADRGLSADRVIRSGEDVADADKSRPQERQGKPRDDGEECATALGDGWGAASGRIIESGFCGVVNGMAAQLDPPNWWLEEPEGVPRVAQGVADRVHRLKALGNGQVPLQAAMAWRILSRGLASGAPI
jgi:DNA (cytosine-5)-methyltransferase 1